MSASGPDRRFNVFLAYNSQDDDAVKKTNAIWNALHDDNLEIWFAPRSVVGGEPSLDEMTKGLMSSECCFMLHGAKTLGLWQKRYERLLATQLRVTDEDFRVCHVLLPGAKLEAAPLDLQVWARVDLRDAFVGDDLTKDGLTLVLATARRQSVDDYLKERTATESPPTTGQSRALLVGVSTYADPELKELHGPGNDIAELRRALEDAGAPGGQEWSVKECENPDYDELRRALEELFSDESEPEDTVLFYYSGHGVLDRNDSYLCATNSDVKHPSVRAIPARQLADFVSISSAASKVVILDCCHGARLDDTVFEELEGNVAVVLGSRGPADDAKVISQPSPFTRNLIGVLSDGKNFREGGMTVGDLLDALALREEKPWTNKHCTREIVLATRPARSEPPEMEAGLEVTLAIPADSIEDDRVQLLSQLTATLDGMLALAAAEGEVPSIAGKTISLLAGELRRLVPEGQLKALGEALDRAADGPTTCSVHFADDRARSKLRDLPWEYLCLHARAADGERGPITPRGLAVARVFPVSGTKQSVRTVPQRVALFSSLGRIGDTSRRLLPTETAKQLGKIGLALDVPEALTWGVFCSSPDEADVVVLQTPLRLDGDEVKVLFAGPSPDEPKPVSWTSVRDQLKEKRALTWLVIETVADESRSESSFAVRRLAHDLATTLERQVVGICHSRAYLRSFAETPQGTAFTAHLLWQLNAGWSLDRAAHAARQRVMSSLAIDDPAIVGLPIVMRPFEEEPLQPQRPVARRNDAA